MRPAVAEAFIRFAWAYFKEGYKPFSIQDAIEFLKPLLDDPAILSRADDALCRMRIPQVESFIRRVEFPHKSSIPRGAMEFVQQNLDNISLNVASSEHSGQINWWRNPLSQENILHVTIAMLLCIPETGEPDVRCKAMIHGICDHYSDASHGAAYRGCIPVDPLRFVFDMVHHLGWCERCGSTQGAD